MSDMVVLQGVPFGKDICLMISGYASCGNSNSGNSNGTMGLSG